MAGQIELSVDAQPKFNKQLHIISQALAALKQVLPEDESLEGSDLDTLTKLAYQFRDKYDSIPF